MGSANRLHWRVEGMDCASCVAKMAKAIERLPGVSDVEVNLMAERLSLSLADGTTTAAVEKQVAALGYTAIPQSSGHSGRPAEKHEPGRACTGDHDHDHAPAGPPSGPAASANVATTRYPPPSSAVNASRSACPRLSSRTETSTAWPP